jgi:2-dehydro-3-deoxyphosphogluconate aldolase / (4S)-4-hydroxy-2-oxoglutarate aldolase
VKPGRDDVLTGRAGRLHALLQCGAVAVVRLPSASSALDVVHALQEGGVNAIEVTLTTPGALETIRALRARSGSTLVVGAGSVLGADSARQCVDAGADFIVSPVLQHNVLEIAHRHDIPMLPGAFTPTEALAAYDAGADVVKIFPADALGPSYLRAMLAPMPFLPLMPTGGVTPANIDAWFAAGAVAVGLGSALVDPALVKAGDLGAITERARQVTAAVARVRSGQGA